MDLIEQLRLRKPKPDYIQEEQSRNGVDQETSGSYEFKRAAVLICLFQDESGQIRVILTKRSSALSTHSGEVALPGGKREEGDADDTETALREANEEIGLKPCLVEVVAVLEPFLSKHFIMVVPVIGILANRKAFTPVLNTSEVDMIFDVPLEMFLKDENRRSEERVRLGSKFLIHYFNFEIGDCKLIIWGFTARVLIHAASVVYQRPPPFLEGKPLFRKYSLQEIQEIEDARQREKLGKNMQNQV